MNEMKEKSTWPEKMKNRRGVYSDKAVEAGHSTFWYQMADGSEKELTQIVSNISIYGWPDTEDRGRPEIFVRDGKKDTTGIWK